MRARRPGLTKFAAGIAATCTAGSLAVLATTAAADGSGSSTASVHGSLPNLAASGEPGEAIVLPSKLVAPTVDAAINDMVSRESGGTDCTAGTPATDPASNLCETKSAFDQDAGSGRTLDLGRTIDDGDLDRAAVILPVRERVKELANSYGIDADDTFPTASGEATLPDAVGTALATSGLDGVLVTDTSSAPTSGSEPTTTTGTTTTGTPTTGPTTGTTTTTTTTSTTGTTTLTNPTTTTDAPSDTTSTMAPPSGSGASSSNLAAPPPASETGDSTTGPAESASGSGSDRDPLAPTSAPAGHVPDFSLLPTGELLDKLPTLVPLGDSVPATAPGTAAQPSQREGHHRVELRTAGSAKAISPDSPSTGGRLAAMLSALLGLTLVTGALARTWVVRRSR